VGVGAADAPLRAFAKGVEAAGPHDADTAGQPQGTEAAALGVLGLVPFPNGLHPLLAGLFLQGQRVGL